MSHKPKFRSWAGLLSMEGASVVAVVTTAPRLERHVAPKQWEGGSSGSKTAQPQWG